ncbi:IS21-like element helper ATPase IstB [Methylocaldum sp. SAD2]|jgi:DNA replication protein DnaC|uniref:IS21-like element helper ATPase IstB n=1 Tax=Methylocaldum sp. GT1BB TaxID=3438963 RepID=UPI000A31F74F
MLNQQTLNQLKALRLDGMARSFEEQLAQPITTELSFEERFALLVDREVLWRDHKRRDRLLKQAKLKHPQACLEDLDHRPGRGLDKPLIATLGGGDWIRQAHALLIGGATGTGKTWLACALGQQACRQGFSTFYARVPRLLDTLRIAHGDGSFGKRLAQLARIDVLILDDWGLTPLDQTARHDLLEVIDDRVGIRATIITSQLPIDHWHGWLNDPTLADAILDRLVHQSYRLILKGESLRKKDRQNVPKEN